MFLIVPFYLISALQQMWAGMRVGFADGVNFLQFL